MKFQQVLPLQKHIDATFLAGSLPRVYFVVHSQREERRSLLEKISQKIMSLTQAEVSFLEGDFGPVYEALGTRSLFGGEEIVVWDGIKKLTEEVQAKILSYAKNPSPFSFFLIGLESLKAFPSLPVKDPSFFILLDGSEEKPWEKEKRVGQEVLFFLKEHGKTITPKALSMLFTGTSGDTLYWESELAKIVSYVGARISITENDLLAIGSFSIEQNAWYQAEKVFWEDGAFFNEVDTSFVLAFIGQLRFLAQQARQVAWLLREKKEVEEVAKSVTMRPNQLLKLIDRLRFCKINYLEEALELLYQVEVMAKNSSLSGELLLDLLIIKLKRLRSIYVK